MRLSTKYWLELDYYEFKKVNLEQITMKLMLIRFKVKIKVFEMPKKGVVLSENFNLKLSEWSVYI